MRIENADLKILIIKDDVIIVAQVVVVPELGRSPGKIGIVSAALRFQRGSKLGVVFREFQELRMIF